MDKLVFLQRNCLDIQIPTSIFFEHESKELAVQLMKDVVKENAKTMYENIITTLSAPLIRTEPFGLLSIAADIKYEKFLGCVIVDINYCEILTLDEYFENNKWPKNENKNIIKTN